MTTLMDKRCGTFDIRAFWTYWACMIIFSSVYGFYLNFSLVLSTIERRMCFTLFQTLLNCLNFISWSLIRPKPLSCYLEINEKLSPVLFISTCIISLISGILFVKLRKFKDNDLKIFIKFGIPEYPPFLDE